MRMSFLNEKEAYHLTVPDPALSEKQNNSVFTPL